MNATLADELLVVVLVSLVPSGTSSYTRHVTWIIYKQYSRSYFCNFNCGLYRRIHGGSSLTSLRDLFFKFNPYTKNVRIEILC